MAMDPVRAVRACARRSRLLVDGARPLVPHRIHVALVQGPNCLQQLPEAGATTPWPACALAGLAHYSCPLAASASSSLSLLPEDFLLRHPRLERPSPALHPPSTRAAGAFAKLRKTPRQGDIGLQHEVTSSPPAPSQVEEACGGLFPPMVQKILIINVPTLFSPVWSVVSAFLPQQHKVCLCGSRPPAPLLIGQRASACVPACAFGDPPHSFAEYYLRAARYGSHASIPTGHCLLLVPTSPCRTEP